MEPTLENRKTPVPRECASHRAQPLTGPKQQLTESLKKKISEFDRLRNSEKHNHNFDDEDI